MSFRDKMAADMKYRVLNTDEFAENIVYTPYGGTAKTIKALVTRGQLEAVPQDQNRSLNRRAEIYIANDATLGVASVLKGQDEIQMPVYEGGSTAETWSVIEIISKDSGAWRLLVTR